MTPVFSPAFMTFRRMAGFALLALAPLTLAARAAFAQSEPPYADAAPTTQSADPPGRVARLNYTAGTVTTEPAGENDWSYALVNRPLTTGDQLWNDANARSELHIGSTAVRLGASTSLDVMNLDDTNAQLKIAQGTLSTRVRSVPSGSSYEIDTPNVALGVTQPGDYRVDVAPDGGTTTVTVRSGALTAYGENGQVPIEAGQRIAFTGTNLQEAAAGEAPGPDDFDQWAANRDAAADRSVSARYVSRDIPGYEDLDANGRWSNDPQYGAVWTPNQEPAGWAPYHDGHWAWIAPWGWTWVDDAPWGFAPYHYGRWAYVHSSWCWVPGPLVASAPPVYAPALVAFVGGGGGGGGNLGWSVSLSIGGATTPGLAWFPLGPGEAWRPGWGGWSPRYYERVNRTVIVNRNVNVTNIHNTYINYRAPGAVTAMPAAAFVHGKSVAHFAQHVDPRQWGSQVRINPGAAGVAPVRDSRVSGLRPATYRPPQTISARPIVATRAPATPAAYRDGLAQHLAQAGGRVPGAGQPAINPSGPAPFAGPTAAGARGTAQMPAHNVRIVDTHSPLVAPMHGPAHADRRLGEPGKQAGPQPQMEGGRGQAAPAAPTPPSQQRQPGMAQQPNLQHAPAATEHALPNNGVPRPPAMGHSPEHGSEASERRTPAWTQPHSPVAQQRLPMNEPRAAADSAPKPPSPMQRVEPRLSQSQSEPRQPQSPQPPVREQATQPEPRAEQPRPQPQPQQPHFEQTHRQPQPQQPHFEQPHPQPQPQQPRIEQPRPHPQPQQPHFEQPHPQPQQHQPHEQPHAAGPSQPASEHHRG